MTAPRYFCTLFDAGYLFKGVSMLRSLKRHCPQAHIFVLCMDEATQTLLEQLALPDIVLLPLSTVEDEALLTAKRNRGVAEYCWTLSPALPSYVLQIAPEVDFITYLDADLLFYSSPEPLFAEIGPASIAIIEHRFTPRLKPREVNGRFCVEWVSFRRDEEGMACLSRWREQCLEWCYYRLEEGKMGDQKYLEEWPDRYRSCHIIQHLGAGLAPWNYPQYRIETSRDSETLVDGSPLIFYHFHQFQILSNGQFDRLSSFYTQERPEPEAVYAPYEEDLRFTMAEVKAIAPDFVAGVKSPSEVRGRRWIQQLVPMWVKEIGRKMFRY